MATAKQVAKIGQEFPKLDNRNASVVLTLTFALIRDQTRMASLENGSDEAPAHGGVINRIGYAEFDQRATLRDPLWFLYWKYVAKRDRSSRPNLAEVEA